MVIVIANEHIKATFASKGAELQSISGVHSGTEYLWSGDPDFWGKYSPVLFPIVGALKENTYYYKDRAYSLPRHGFARDMEFDYQMIDEHELLFTLKHNEATLKVYPFEFELRLRYRIYGASLCCTYEVLNPAAEELLFSVGAHPAFAAPLNNQGCYTDYFLQFNQDDKLTYHHIVNNLISDQTSTISLSDGKLPLKHELFYDDALVFKNLKSNEISLMNTKNYNGLSFKFEGFPYFGIWAAKDADFVCLEPWCGIADPAHSAQQLIAKEGIERLEPKGQWERTWKVTFF